MATAPLRATLSVKAAGPKSGFQAGSLSFLGRPSYSPLRLLARLRRFSSLAANS